MYYFYKDANNAAFKYKSRSMDPNLTEITSEEYLHLISCVGNPLVITDEVEGIVAGSVNSARDVRLKTEFEKLGCNVIFATHSQLKKVQDFKNVKFIVRAPYAIQQQIKSMNNKFDIRFFNKGESVLLASDKWFTYLYFKEHNIPTPNTQETVEGLTYPYIIKAKHGSLGEQVYLIQNLCDRLLAEKYLKGKEIIYQQFISTSYGRDVRVFCIGGEPVAWCERRNENDFRANIHLGGKAYPIDIPEEWKQTCSEIANGLDLDVCGIDILYGENNVPIYNEVNSNPMFSGIEKATGTNLMKLYAAYILKEVSDHD